VNQLKRARATIFDVQRIFSCTLSYLRWSELFPLNATSPGVKGSIQKYFVGECRELSQRVQEEGECEFATQWKARIDELPDGVLKLTSLRLFRKMAPALAEKKMQRFLPNPAKCKVTERGLTKVTFRTPISSSISGRTLKLHFTSGACIQQKYTTTMAYITTTTIKQRVLIFNNLSRTNPNTLWKLGDINLSQINRLPSVWSYNHNQMHPLHLCTLIRTRMHAHARTHVFNS